MSLPRLPYELPEGRDIRQAPPRLDREHKPCARAGCHGAIFAAPLSRLQYLHRRYCGGRCRNLARPKLEGDWLDLALAPIEAASNG